MVNGQLSVVSGHEGKSEQSTAFTVHRSPFTVNGSLRLLRLLLGLVFGREERGPGLLVLLDQVDHDVRVGQRARVAEAAVLAVRDGPQDAPHDLPRARLRQVVRELLAHAHRDLVKNMYTLLAIAVQCMYIDRELRLQRSPS